MKLDEVFGGGFFKAEDVIKPVLVTITGIDLEWIRDAQRHGEEQKPIVSFKETDKRLVLNLTNKNLLKRVAGSDDTEAMIGLQIVLYCDESVPNPRGGPPGGVRIRAPKQAQKFSLPPSPEPAGSGPSDDVPF